MTDVNPAPPDASPPADQDWFDAEQPIGRVVREDLQRLKYRAKARLLLITTIAAVLTAGLMWKIAHKPPNHRAKVILALQEGMTQRETPMPMRDLRTYVTTVLMPAAELTKLIEKRDLFPLRKKQGPEFAIAELWDIVEIEVFRNYFLYDHDEMGEARSARIAITVRYADPDEAYEIARDLATLVINSAAHERDRAATAMRDDAARATEAAGRRLAELEAELATLSSARAEAEANDQRGVVEALKVDIAAVENSAKRAKETLSALARSSSEDQLNAAVFAAGLSLDVGVVEERKPEPIVPGKYRFAMMTVVLFVTFLILVALFLGAFDSRIHDLDDVSRLGIPVVGQVPGFPGDGVGSLRQRGVRSRGVTLSWR